MPLVQGSPGMAFVPIQTAGGVVRCSQGSLLVRHFILSAPEDNQQSVVIGLGAATADGIGLHWKRFRPGDDYEYPGWEVVDLQYLYLNNNASTGHAGDGIMIIKLGFD